MAEVHSGLCSLLGVEPFLVQWQLGAEGPMVAGVRVAEVSCIQPTTFYHVGTYMETA